MNLFYRKKKQTIKNKLKNKIRNISKKNISVFLLASVLLVINMPMMTAQAYFNRGMVQLSIGSDIAKLTAGDNYNISVLITPDSYTGFPGCGLAKCPEECDPGCILDGMCQCAGTIPQTTNASLSIAIANTAIASASYSAGVLSITGIGVGDTTITVQGTLKEYTNSNTQVIHVTVVKNTSTGGVSSGNSDTGSANNSGKGSAIVSPVEGNSSVAIVSPAEGNSSVATGGDSAGSLSNDTTNNAAGQAAGNTGNTSGASTQPSKIADSNVVSIIGSDATIVSTSKAEAESNGKSETLNVTETATEIGGNEKGTFTTPNEGTVDIITLNTLVPTGKDDLQMAKERGTSVTFQKLDSSHKVLYSWTFLGQDISEPQSFNMGIELSDEPRVLKSDAAQLKNPLYLSFAHEGGLPGTAKVYISVGDSYPDGEKLFLYYMDADKKKLELMDDSIVVTGGYASFSMVHCSDYALTTSRLTEQSPGISPFLIIGIIGIIGIVCFLFVTKTKRKKGKTL